MKPDPKSTDFVKVYRGDIEQCNICLSETRMTWDHVPPRGGIDIARMKQYTVIEYLSGQAVNPKCLPTQNGVKFKTLCKQCNSQLGKQYDTAMNAFARATGKIIKSPISLPSQVLVPTKPARLLRSLFGHLLAAKGDVERTKPDEAMRRYVSDPGASCPDELNVFYFVYPYEWVYVARDILMLAKRGRFDKCAIFSILKYFPVAYIVASIEEYEGLQSFPAHNQYGLDDEIEIPIRLNEKRPRDWPEVVDAGNLVAGGGVSAHSSILAVPEGDTLRI